MEENTIIQDATQRVQSLDLSLGPRLGGQYQVVSVLGRGGMGEVFLATDAAGHQVAVKALRSDLGGYSPE